MLKKMMNENNRLSENQLKMVFFLLIPVLGIAHS